MSNSVRPFRQKPTRFLHPWDSPGKNTGVGCHFLLQCMKVKSENEVSQSCLTLRDPVDCSLPGSSVHGIFQARVLEWGYYVPIIRSSRNNQFFRLCKLKINQNRWFKSERLKKVYYHIIYVFFFPFFIDVKAVSILDYRCSLHGGK